MIKTNELIFRPLNKSTWQDFEKLLGERGACGGCWCMSWRLQRAEFERQKGSGNKAAMKKLALSRLKVGQNLAR